MLNEKTSIKVAAYHEYIKRFFNNLDCDTQVYWQWFVKGRKTVYRNLLFILSIILIDTIIK